MTTLLDADRDGTFDAVTGGLGGPHSRHGDGCRARGAGQRPDVQLFDDADRLVAQEPIAAPDDTLAFDVPASSAYYRARSDRAVVADGLPDPLDYVDTVEVVSSPVWTTAPPRHGEVPRLPTGPATRLASADWSGFPRLARSGDVVHAVWQERAGTQYRVAYARSTSGGATFACHRSCRPHLMPECRSSRSTGSRSSSSGRTTTRVGSAGIWWRRVVRRRDQLQPAGGRRRGQRHETCRCCRRRRVPPGMDGAA